MCTASHRGTHIRGTVPIYTEESRTETTPKKCKNGDVFGDKINEEEITFSTAQSFKNILK